MAKKVFESAGYSVLTAEDGAEAIKSTAIIRIQYPP